MSQNKGGQFFLILFGMIFLAVGGVMGFFSLQTLIRAEAMRTWRDGAGIHAGGFPCVERAEGDGDGAKKQSIWMPICFVFARFNYFTAIRIKV